MPQTLIKRPTLTHVQLDELQAIRDTLRSFSATGTPTKLSRAHMAQLSSRLTVLIQLALSQEALIAVGHGEPVGVLSPTGRTVTTKPQVQSISPVQAKPRLQDLPARRPDIDHEPKPVTSTHLSIEEAKAFPAGDVTQGLQCTDLGSSKHMVHQRWTAPNLGTLMTKAMQVLTSYHPAGYGTAVTKPVKVGDVWTCTMSRSTSCD